LQANAATKRPVARELKLSAADPGINVVFKTIEHEACKTDSRNFLVADTGPNVGMWFAGNQMAGFIDVGLFGDISDA